MIWQTVSTSSDDTERLGELLAQNLREPAVIELRADLGGGKTTFVKGLAKGLGSQDRVSSPTFTLKRIYQAGDRQIHHYDFYRLEAAGIMREEITESLTDPKVITIVEWANAIDEVLPAKRLIIEIKPQPQSQDEREVTFIYHAGLTNLIVALQNARQEKQS